MSPASWLRISKSVCLMILNCDIGIKNNTDMVSNLLCAMERNGIKLEAARSVAFDVSTGKLIQLCFSRKKARSLGVKSRIAQVFSMMLNCSHPTETVHCTEHYKKKKLKNLSRFCIIYCEREPSDAFISISHGQLDLRSSSTPSAVQM